MNTYLLLQKSFSGISRTSGPVFEQLRVFVRKGSQILQDEGGMLDALTAEMRVEEEVEVGTTTITAADIGDAADEITAQVKKVADGGCRAKCI